MEKLIYDKIDNVVIQFTLYPILTVEKMILNFFKPFDTSKKYESNASWNKVHEKNLPYGAVSLIFSINISAFL